MNLLPHAAPVGRPATPPSAAGPAVFAVPFVTELGTRLSERLRHTVDAHHRVAALPEGGVEHRRAIGDLVREVVDLIQALRAVPGNLLGPAERAEVEAVLSAHLPVARDTLPARAEEKLFRALGEFAAFWAPARLGESRFHERWRARLRHQDAELAGIESFAGAIAGGQGVVAPDEVVEPRAQALAAFAEQLVSYRWPWQAVLATAPVDAPLSATQVLALFVGAASHDTGNGDGLAAELARVLVGSAADRVQMVRLWASHEPCLRTLVARGLPLTRLDLLTQPTNQEQIAITGSPAARQWLALADAPLAIVRDGAGIVGQHLPIQPIVVQLVGAVGGYAERLFDAVERHTEPAFAVRRLPGQRSGGCDLRFYSQSHGLYLPLRLVDAEPSEGAAAYLVRLDESLLDGSAAANGRLAKLDDALGVDLHHRRTIGGRGAGAPLVLVVAASSAQRLHDSVAVRREVVPALQWPLLFVHLAPQRGESTEALPTPRARFQAAVEGDPANNRSRAQQALIRQVLGAFPRALDEALAGGCPVQILFEGESLAPLSLIARALEPRFRAVALPFLQQRRADSERTAQMVSALLRQYFELPMEQARIHVRQGELGIKLARAGAIRGRFLKASLDRANLAAERLELGAKAALARAGQLLGLKLSGTDLATDADRCRRELDAVRQRVQWLAGI